MVEGKLDQYIPKPCEPPTVTLYSDASRLVTLVGNTTVNSVLKKCRNLL